MSKKITEEDIKRDIHRIDERVKYLLDEYFSKPENKSKHEIEITFWKNIYELNPEKYNYKKSFIRDFTIEISYETELDCNKHLYKDFSNIIDIIKAQNLNLFTCNIYSELKKFSLFFIKEDEEFKHLTQNELRTEKLKQLSNKNLWLRILNWFRINFIIHTD